MEGDEQPRPNPMEIEVVIRKVLEKSSAKDLKNLRLVSKKWNYDCRRLIGKSHVVNVTGSLSRSTIPGADAVRWNALRPAATLLEFMSSQLDVGGRDLMVPFQHLSLRWWLMGRPRWDEDDGHLLFYSVYGRRLTSLELCFCFVTSTQVFHKVLIESFPNLEELRLVDIRVLEVCNHPTWEVTGGRGRLPKLKYLELVGDSDGMARLDWMDIFQESPNLKTLILRNMNMKSMGTVLGHLTWVTARQEETLKITRLEILETNQEHDMMDIERYMLFYNALIRLLVTAIGLPLETLVMDLYVSREEQQQLRGVYAATLQNLEVHEWPMAVPVGEAEGDDLEIPDQIEINQDDDDEDDHDHYWDILIGLFCNMKFFLRSMGLVAACVFTEYLAKKYLTWRG